MSAHPVNSAVSCLIRSPFDQTALTKTLAECRARLGTRPDLVVAFVSSDLRHRLDEIVESLRIDGEAARIFGGSCEGMIGVGTEAENTSGVSLAFLSLPGTALELYQSEAELAQSRLLDLDPTGFLALSNPLEADLAGPVRWLNTHFPSVPVAGGFVSGGPEERDLFLFTEEGRAVSANLVLGMVGGVKLVPLVAQSCRPIGEPLVITQSRSNVVQAIAGKKPYKVLEETFTSLEDSLRHAAEGNIFAGLAVREEVEDYATGDFVIRHIVGTDLNGGKLVLTSPTRVGQMMQFQLRDAVAAKRDLEERCDRLVEEHGKPFAALVCAGRGRGRKLYGEPDQDVSVLRDRLGPTPLAGCFSNGEFAPVAGVNFRHDHSLCGAMLFS